MRTQMIAVLALGAIGILSADTVKLRNGSSVQGTFLGGTARQVRIEVNGNVQTYDVGDVTSIAFSEGNVAQTPPPSQAPAPRTSSAPGRRIDPDPVRGITIPADTMITVRMIDPVDSQSARTGQTFQASLDEPIIVNGQTIASRGVDVLTKLVASEQSGKFQGRTSLTLALVTINLNGRPVEVSSADVETESASRGARTGKVVGGTAALGAVIGAIAGGGKGAAIGATSGAAVGAGAQAVTNGQQVKIPAETRLVFRLQAPVQL